MSLQGYSDKIKDTGRPVPFILDVEKKFIKGY